MKEIRFITMFTLLLLMTGMSVSALAQENTQMTPPRIITLATLSLSPELQDKYAEQTLLVKIKATVSEYGAADGDVQIMTSSGDIAFDNAVIALVKESEFSPAYRGNTAVSSSILLPLHVKVEKNIPEEQAIVGTQPVVNK
ncbi:energy transducer TonB [Pelosinus sp. sgz500959]|uniref:energy transducer TonB n=1 Tax=Pelosinus sp. sgz500959 TaxID=3242472 RepID=UPI003670E694